MSYNYGAVGDAYPCSSCGLMITDPVQHHRNGTCRARKAEKCKGCGLMKLENIEHKCSVTKAIQENNYAFLTAIARLKTKEITADKLKYPTGPTIGKGKK